MLKANQWLQCLPAKRGIAGLSMRWMALVCCINSYAESVDEPISGFADSASFSLDTRDVGESQFSASGFADSPPFALNTHTSTDDVISVQLWLDASNIDGKENSYR